MSTAEPVSPPDRQEAANARLTIDLGALEWNWRRMRDLSGQADCGAAVKADAYGTGLAAAAPRLWRAGCRDFFVADANEGLALRRLLPEATVHVLCGPFGGALPLYREAGLVPVLNSLDQVALWREAGAGGPFALHVDTGMNRLGVRPDEAAALAADPGFSPVLVMSHFACADEPGHPLNAAQIDRFSGIARLFPRARASLANSAGIHLGTPAHFDLTRPGIALYGGEAVAGLASPMRPVVTAEARILVLRRAPAGETVGYGAAARLSRDSLVAVCGVGYADGYHRAGSGAGVPLRNLTRDGACGALGEHKVPLLGRVTMDLVMFDVTDLPEGSVSPGDWIELFGRTVALDDAARAAGTIGYEFLTGLGRRYARRFVG